MRDMAARQIGEKWRQVAEMCNPRGYNYRVRMDNLPVRGLAFEAFRSTACRSNIRSFARWHQTPLQFDSVGGEDFKWNWSTNGIIGQIHFFAIMTQSERRIRIIETGRESFRL